MSSCRYHGIMEWWYTEMLVFKKDVIHFKPNLF